MGKEKRPFCCHQNFVPSGLSASSQGYIYIWWNMKKMYIKSDFKAIFLKPATNGQSDKGFLLTSTFVPKGLSAPALGLYTFIKALKHIPGPGVRWAFTGLLVLWLWRTDEKLSFDYHQIPSLSVPLIFLPSTPKQPWLILSWVSILFKHFICFQFISINIHFLKCWILGNGHRL